MGISNLPYICKELITHGKGENTPVAIIQQGTTVNQRTVIGTLSTIVHLAKSEEVTNPAMIVVGEVVRFREKIRQLQLLNQDTNDTARKEVYELG
jgi:uroporphyrin-III C-methyltransferase